jgi:Fe-S-cluster-containing hydrogenase component 2
MKCDLCDGLDEPKCVKYCWAEALQYVPSERAGVTLARAKSEKFMELAGKEM